MDSDNYQGYLQNNTIFKVLIEESVSPVGLYVGRQMVIQLANKAILKVWDKDESVIGKTFRDALPELEGQPFFNCLMMCTPQALLTKPKYLHTEMKQKRIMIADDAPGDYGCCGDAA